MENNIITTIIDTFQIDDNFAYLDGFHSQGMNINSKMKSRLLSNICTRIFVTVETILGTHSSLLYRYIIIFYILVCSASMIKFYCKSA